jgi:Fe-S cluster assembly scaffold protein SufB
LEIGADQVKATHGSTIGTLDEETLFYLRSRGISDKESRRLALHGFCREIIDEVPWGSEVMHSWIC